MTTMIAMWKNLQMLFECQSIGHDIDADDDDNDNNDADADAADDDDNDNDNDNIDDDDEDYDDDDDDGNVEKVVDALPLLFECQSTTAASVAFDMRGRSTQLTHINQL